MSDEEKELTRRLILEGRGWHDEDGPTTVDGIDPDEGAGYPVKYHWASGGAGADSVAGFLRSNYLPTEETVRIAAAALAEARSRVETLERRVGQACEALGVYAADAVQFGEDGVECRTCGHLLGDECGRHSHRCVVPVIEDVLQLLAATPAFPQPAAPARASSARRTPSRLPPPYP